MALTQEQRRQLIDRALTEESGLQDLVTCARLAAALGLDTDDMRRKAEGIIQSHLRDGRVFASGDYGHLADLFELTGPPLE